jgi:hypothetical protein
MTQQLTDKVTVTKVLSTAATKELNSMGYKPSYYLTISVKRHSEKSIINLLPPWGNSP